MWDPDTDGAATNRLSGRGGRRHQSTRAETFPQVATNEAVTSVDGGPRVHPGMLESAFLATMQSDSDADGAVASLSLEEVPYDRDLR